MALALTFRIMYDLAKKGRSAIIGNGENFIPNIYAGDAAAAIIAAVEKLLDFKENALFSFS